MANVPRGQLPPIRGDDRIKGPIRWFDPEVYEYHREPTRDGRENLPYVIDLPRQRMYILDENGYELASQPYDIIELELASELPNYE
jgi:hypothetical protein